MAGSQVLGFVLLALPFVLIFVLATAVAGFRLAVATFAVAGLVVASVHIGQSLLKDGAAPTPATPCAEAQ